MKSKSSSLEILAIISQSEMLDLANKPIEGTLKYTEDEETREIHINIIQKKDQRELVEVIQEPQEVYFGKATKATFSINSQFYDSLLKERYAGSRFYGAIGKLEIEVCPNI